MKSAELIEKYRLHGLYPAGELVLLPSLALNFIDDASANGIAVTGIEMVRVRETAVVPDLNWIADFSAAFEADGTVAATAAAARSFIKSLPSDPAVRVIIGLSDESE